ncbi:hypothetical protein HNP98_004319 [Hymenobacter sp. 9A]|uniref:Uncharacterized protein n=1 Tax=Hymenobacter caeli TaxID=2735894 RepID=A0ABX2FWW1_9BACT|nr:hypothetical protein [Hymenobacter caeli]NRT21472.1 hypothetical protein [Hymenobacter caeli]
MSGPFKPLPGTTRWPARWLGVALLLGLLLLLGRASRAQPPPACPASTPARRT